jgi:ABC-type Na+ efflux pump permease subunit
MGSWAILRRLLGFWTAVDNPVFWRETFRPPIWHGIVAWFARATGVALALGGLACYFTTLLVLYLRSPLVPLLPVLLIWTLLIGLALAPTVVAEREQRTWETLRTTPLALDQIVLSKASGALWWLRHLVRAMTGVLLIAGIGVGLGSFVIASPPGGSGPGRLPGLVLCGATVVLPLGSALLFILDRTQHFVLTCVAALGVSASSSTVRASLSGASVAVLSVLLVDTGIAAIVLALQPGHVITEVGAHLLMQVTLGPTVSYLAELPLISMLLYVTVTLVARELVIRALWRWTLRRAGDV